MLRDYQQRAIDELYKWFSDGHKGHPCLELPTGSGKSHIIAALCRDAKTQWPETRILMLTHVKELIEQNAEKMRDHWPNALLVFTRRVCDGGILANRKPSRKIEGAWKRNRPASRRANRKGTIKWDD